MSKEEEIRKLWRDPSFSGSFSGIGTFQAALELEKGIKISKSDLIKIMKEDTNFLLETHKLKKHIKRRPMIVHGYCNLWQADLGELFPFDGFLYFLCCIDVFSHKIFARALRSKSAKSVQSAFQEIFEEAGQKPLKLETDQGTEFQGNRAFFKQSKIYFKIKTGDHKASFSENAVKKIKTRLFRLLRTLLTKAWPDYLQQVVAAINNSKNSAIGGLRPADIKSNLDDVKIDDKIGIKEDVDFEKQIKNQANYEKNKKNLLPGDYVYVPAFPPSPLGKSFDSKRYQLYIIDRVDAGKTPPLYKLKDLASDPVAGSFLPSQLARAPPPSKGDYFRVEKVIRSKTVNKKKQYLVKFLHYPAKFNQWIPEADLTGK